MTCSLGDINFEVFPGLTSYDDSKEMTYAQIPLAAGKPTLQRTGEKLNEIDLVIVFKDAFCVPEDEYKKLDKKRVLGEICAFIWGTGEIEGDFVIGPLSKTMDELGAGGQWKTITCTLKLIEAYSPNELKQSVERSKLQKAAFATNVNHALPANVKVTEPSPATDLMDDVQGANMGAQEVTDNMDKAVTQSAIKSTAIEQAQQFVDESKRQSFQLSKLISQTKDLLNTCGIKLAANSNMQTIAPLLSAQIAASTTVMNDAENLLSDYNTLPDPVNNLSDANTVLAVMNDTVNTVTDLRDSFNLLKTASQPLAVAIATRKDV